MYLKWDARGHTYRLQCECLEVGYHLRWISFNLDHYVITNYLNDDIYIPKRIHFLNLKDGTHGHLIDYVIDYDNFNKEKLLNLIKMTEFYS
jgi:hypothetical protein